MDTVKRYAVGWGIPGISVISASISAFIIGGWGAAFGFFAAGMFLSAIAYSIAVS